MRTVLTTLCTALMLAGIAPTLSAQFQLDQFEGHKDIFENPEQYITKEEVERLRAPGDNEKLRQAAQDITTETNARIDEELQRLKFDEQDWLFTRDENAEIEKGAGLGKNLKPKSALGLQGDVRYVVYLSLGMPDIEFEEAMKAIKARDDTFGVIIGLAEKNHTIPDTMKLLFKRWNDHDPEAKEPPLIYLDPNLFNDYGVSSVPTIIRFDGSTPTLKVQGMLNVDWVADQFELGRRGTLGQQGPIYEIAEENFMDTVKRRMANLDTDKMKAEAKNRFWNNQKFARLPPARKTASFVVDLTFTVNESIKTPSGKILATKGDKVNPLDIMPFRRIGLVFDGSKPEQVAWAIKEVQRAKQKNTLPIVMITDLDISEDGWKAFEELNNSIAGFPLKMANAPIVERFQVEKVPSRFEQDGNMIRVTEFGKEDY
jgi:conjugal transfer pilus assembly protein TraW